LTYRRQTLAAFALLVAVASSPSISRADESQPASAPFVVPQVPTSPAEWEALRRSQQHEVFYGWQTATADAVAVGMLLLGANFKDRGVVPFEVLGVAAYTLAPPTVHVGHGAVIHAIESLVLRAVLPLAGFSIGYFSSGARSDVSVAARMHEGELTALPGAALAAAVDAAFLGWDRWSTQPAAPRQAGLGFGGSF
jgi:hypothetical protein